MLLSTFDVLKFNVFNIICVRLLQFLNIDSSDLDIFCQIEYNDIRYPQFNEIILPKFTRVSDAFLNIISFRPLEEHIYYQRKKIILYLSILLSKMTQSTFHTKQKTLNIICIKESLSLNISSESLLDYIILY